MTEEEKKRLDKLLYSFTLLSSDQEAMEHMSRFSSEEMITNTDKIMKLQEGWERLQRLYKMRCISERYNPNFPIENPIITLEGYPMPGFSITLYREAMKELEGVIE